MTTTDLIGYYTGLLILQYASLPNAIDTIKAITTTIIQNQIIQGVQDAFDLATAIGAQLDLLGTYRGIPRTIFGITALNDWSLVPCADPAPNSYLGWALAAGANPTWRWLQVNDLDSLPYSLSDAQMRALIQLKAKFDSWDGTLGSIDNILYTFFGTQVTLIDNFNMNIVYQHQVSDPDTNQLFEMARIAGILPNPAGVAFSVTEV